MVAIDTNILVKAHRIDADHHESAKHCIKSIAEESAPWFLCFHTLVEFYGIVTHPKLWETPSSPEQACGQINAWHESPSLTILGDQPEQLPDLLALLSISGVRGPMVHDARVASCCIAYGIHEFWTVDRDFSRFPALRTKNPLV